MKLEQYSSLHEKAIVFKNKYKKIDSCEAFDKWFSGNHGKYFRGVNEAKYKNYTSAQRLYITHELRIHNVSIIDLVKEQVNSLRKVRDGLLNSYYSSLLNLEPSDLLLLSFAQHQKKGIAPLLDFTLDRKIALFFMSDGCDFSSCGSIMDNDSDSFSIEDYCSLYYLTGRNKLSLEKVLETELHAELHKIRNKYKERIKNDNHDSTYSHFLNRQLLVDERHVKERFIKRILSSDIKDMIIESPKRDNVKNGTVLPRIMISNLNITAQQGCFVYHNDGLHPFEDLYCVDIHKSVIPYIRKHHLLLNNSKTKSLTNTISSSFIYPNSCSIVEESINDALSELISKKK